MIRTSKHIRNNVITALTNYVNERPNVTISGVTSNGVREFIDFRTPPHLHTPKTKEV